MDLNEILRQFIEDRLYIKSTHRLRRRIQNHEVSEFFTKNRYKLKKLEREIIKSIDEVLVEYLEEKK